MIHKYRKNNTNFVVDTNSGAIHVVDDISYEILEHLNGVFLDYTENYITKKLSDKYSETEIKEAYKELFELYRNEKLFSKDTYENLSTAEKLKSPIKALCLNVAHDCNLKCSYCFASKGDFGCKRELMPLETAKNAIDFIIKNSASIKNLEVDFFGGEPLMNWEVVKETVKYARGLEEKHSKNFRFTLTTNGVLLDDEKIDFINEEIYDVVLSLDGRKEVNDKYRLTKTNVGSYDIVMPKFQKLVSERGNKSYYVRATYTKDNLDFSNDILHLYKLGFKNLSIEPVLCDDKFSKAVTEEDIEKVLNEHDVMLEKLVNLKKVDPSVNFFNFNIDLNNGPCITKRLKGCGCGNDYVAVTPNGDIFACHQLVGEEQFKMGNVNNQTFDETIKQKFLNTSIYHKEKCRNCWARFYCTGGCAAKNYQNCGNIMTPFEVSCKLQKKKIECAIALQYFSL